MSFACTLSFMQVNSKSASIILIVKLLSKYIFIDMFMAFKSNVASLSENTSNIYEPIFLEIVSRNSILLAKNMSINSLMFS